MNELFVRLWLAMTTGLAREERGQTTAEYALVLIAGATLAGLVITWATKTHSISRLFDAVIDKVLPG